MARLMNLVAAEGVLAGRTNTSIPGNNNIMNFAPALIATKADIDENRCRRQTRIGEILSSDAAGQKTDRIFSLKPSGRMKQDSRKEKS